MQSAPFSTNFLETDNLMGGVTESLAWAGGLLQLPWDAAPPGGWLALAGVVLGLTMFLLWQRRPATVWAEPHGGDAWTAPTYRRSLQRLSMELARMRRYERSLAVVTIRLEGQTAESLAADGRRPRETHFTFWHIGTLLRELLRDCDSVTSDPAEESFVIVLPEANRAQALQAANRLRAAIAATTHERLRVGIAEFPSDGLIIEELVRAAGADRDGRGGVHPARVAQLET